MKSPMWIVGIMLILFGWIVGLNAQKWRDHNPQRPCEGTFVVWRAQNGNMKVVYAKAGETVRIPEQEIWMEDQKFVAHGVGNNPAATPRFREKIADYWTDDGKNHRETFKDADGKLHYYTNGYENEVVKPTPEPILHGVDTQTTPSPTP